MSLINKILPKKGVEEYFIVLGVEEHRITAVVAAISQEKISIVGKGESEFTEGENEIEAADIAISTAEKNISEQILVKKVIFGLPPLFLDQDKIKPEFMDRLKKISQELDLSPQGFIEYPQALSFYLEKKEESPPTLLLLSVGRNNLTLSQVRVGKVERNITVTRSSSVYSDFEKIMSSFSSEILPSKIIIYDEVKGAQLEELREELLRFPWHKHASFLHTPKIEILEEDAINTALVEAAASSLIKELHMDEIKITTEEKKTKEEETFGFTATSLNAIKETPAEETITPIPDNITVPKKQKMLLTLPDIHLPKLSLPPFLADRSFTMAPIFPFFAVIILAILASLSLFWFYPNSTVNLIVYPKTASQQLQVAFTTDASELQTGKNIILANTLSEEVSGEKTVTTTGKTKIGDKASGEVVVYNKTTTSKTFPKGTVLTNGTLKFTLDDDVNVASSSDTGEGLTFGKTTAKITAVEIGPEANIAANSNFTFKDFPQSTAYTKNNNPLSGGTSREVSSISKDDQDNLLKSLSQELALLAKQKITQKISSGEKLLDGSLQSSIVSKKFSSEAGTEAKEVSLKLSVKLDTLVFKESDLTHLVKEDQIPIPSGFTLDTTKTAVQITQTKIERNGTVSAVATITAFLMPQIDKDKIKREIAGRTFAQVGNSLSTYENIAGVEIIKERSLPFFTNTLPFNGNNININLVSR